MKVLDSVHNRYIQRKRELDEALQEAIGRRERARVEGDLRENADYLKACSDIELLDHEYLTVARIVEEGEPVPERTSFNSIDIGCKFRLDLTIDINSGIVDKEALGVFDLLGVKLDNGSDGSTISGEVVIGVETDEFATEGVISTNSPLGKYLMGRSLGTYHTKGPHGDNLKVVVSKCY